MTDTDTDDQRRHDFAEAMAEAAACISRAAGMLDNTAAPCAACKRPHAEAWAEYNQHRQVIAMATKARKIAVSGIAT